MNIKNKGLWTVIALVLALLSIWAVVRGSGIPFNELLARIRAARIRFLIPAVISMLGMIFFEGMAVRCILKTAGYPRPVRRGFLYACADAYFSAITPSATGGQPASAFFMISDKVPGAVAAAALLVNLVMYNLAILSIGLVSVIFFPNLFLHFRPICKVLIVAGFLVLLGMGILFLLLLFKRDVVCRVAVRLIGLMRKLHLVKRADKLTVKLEKAMVEYGSCVRLVGGKRRMWIKVYLFNVCQRIAQFLVTIFVFLAIRGSYAAVASPEAVAAAKEASSGAGILGKLWITQCYVSLGANCVPIPGAMGVTDYLMVDGYTSLMDKDSAFSLQILTRGISFYSCILLSAIVCIVGYYLLRKRKKRG